MRSFPSRRGANSAQREAIGAGLVDARNYFGKLGALHWASEAEARIRRVINLADEGTRIGWTHVEAPTQRRF